MTTNQHLTEEQLYTLLDDAGADATAQAHVASCPRCAAELHTISGGLGNLRAALTGLMATPPAFERPLVVRTQPRFSFGRVSLHGLAAAAAVLVLGVSASVLHPRRVVAPTPAAQTRQAAANLSDDELLDGISRDLSASVPPSLEPLSISAQTSASQSR